MRDGRAGGLWVVCLLIAGGCAAEQASVPPPAVQLAVPSMDMRGVLVEQEPPMPVPAPAPSLASPELEERVARPALPDPETPPAPPRVTEQRGFLLRQRVNLRPCPEETEQCPPVASLRLNEEVRVLGQDEHWLHVRVPRVSREGFVARRFVGPRPAVVPALGADERVATPPAGGRKPRDSATPREGSGGGGQEARAPQEELLQ